MEKEKLKKNSVKTSEDLIQSILRSPYRGYVILGFFIVFFSIISYILGQSTVRDSNTFPILHMNNKSYIFVSYSSNNLLLKPINLKNKLFDDYFELSPITKDVKIEYIQVGKLKIDKPYFNTETSRIHKYQ